MTTVRRMSQAPHDTVENASNRLTSGEASSKSRLGRTPAQKSAAKKIPTNTSALPRSGCREIRPAGTATITPAGISSLNDSGTARRAARWRASIRTVASFATSAGWPILTPPSASHDFDPAAVPAPVPITSVSTKSTTATP